MTYQVISFGHSFIPTLYSMEYMEHNQVTAIV